MFRKLSSLRLAVPHRNLWGWLNTIFNKVDPQRIIDVGPDRACAEWLIRCGAAVKWKGTDIWFNDYNSLPGSNIRMFKIEEIDATESAIMSIGFPHLKGLQHLRKIIFHKCGYLDDEALPMLAHVKGTLRHLQISSSGNITLTGIMSLKALGNLEYLLLYDLPEVTDKDKCVMLLQSFLPDCKIEFPYAQATELGMPEPPPPRNKSSSTRT